MNWLNLSIQTLDSENFVGSDPIERGTWLCLLRYCIGQENGGIISECADWADRKWQQLVRITKKEASRECDLWKWDDNTLIVWGYPCEKETEVRQKRDLAKTNGAKGGRPKKTNVETDEKPTSVIFEKAERKGKEGEGNRNGNGMELPPNPQGGTDGKPTNLPTTQNAIRISQLFNRRLTTKWSDKEILAFKAIGQIDPEELDLVCRYTEAERAKGDNGRHRRDLATFLNNFTGEIDRARQAKSAPVNGSKTTTAASYGI